MTRLRYVGVVLVLLASAPAAAMPTAALVPNRAYLKVLFMIASTMSAWRNYSARRAERIAVPPLR